MFQLDLAVEDGLVDGGLLGHGRVGVHVVVVVGFACEDQVSESAGFLRRAALLVARERPGRA